MIKHAGTLAYEIIRGTTTLKEAIEHLEDWSHSMVEQLSGDDLDIDKGKHRIVEFLVKSVHERKVTLPKGWDDGLDQDTRTALNLEAITADDISLDFDTIQRDFLVDVNDIDERKGSSGDKLASVDKALRRIARSRNLSELEQDNLLGVLQVNCGKGLVSKAALRKGLKKHAEAGIEGTSHGQIAMQVLKDFEEIEMRYDFDQLWEWGGSYWAHKNREEILKHLIQNYGEMPAARRSSDHSGILKTIGSLCAKPIKTLSHYGINFSNGYLDTALRLSAHDKEYGMTYEMPYAYRPELADKAVRFLKFLHDAWDGDQEMVDLVQEAIAVTLFGLGTKYEKCLLLYGVPHSGKSVLLDIVSALVPPEARASLPPHRWHEKFLTAGLQGKVLNVAGELPENTDIQSNTFKTIVSGQLITAEHKNMAPFDFNPIATNWFASNNLPKTKDVSGGFLRRWIILGFTKAVSEATKNVHLADEIIVEEREAIVAWAVEAIDRVMKRNHILVPAKSKALAEQLGAVLNPIRTWFNDMMKVQSTGTVEEEHAYASYQTFSLMKGFRKLDRAVFQMIMREIAGSGRFVCEVLDNGVQRYHGVKLAKIG